MQANLKDGQPCDHKGCLSHLTHPCDGCGRVGGMQIDSRTDRLQEIRERVDKASIGPWTHEQPPAFTTVANTVENVEELTICECYESDIIDSDNAEFIAHARQDVPYLLDALQQAQTENTSVLQGLNYERNMVNELLEAVRWQEAQISVMSAVMSGGQENSPNIKLVKNKKNQELAVIAQELQQYRGKATKLESSRDQWQADYNLKNAECMALERAYEKLEDRERVLRDALNRVLRRESHMVESFENGKFVGKNMFYSATGEIAKKALGQEDKPHGNN